LVKVSFLKYNLFKERNTVGAVSTNKRDLCVNAEKDPKPEVYRKIIDVAIYKIEFIFAVTDL
jgi:hypothetical protein